MKILSPFFRALMTLLVVAMIVLMMAPAYADGDDCIGNSCNKVVTTKEMSSVVDTSVVSGDNKSLALVAPSLGDVDIAACLGSTQWSFLIMGKQKLELNHVCMAEFYLNAGLYDLAAQSLCNQKEILAEYDSELACETAHDFGPPAPPPEPERSNAPVTTSMEIQDELHHEYEQQVSTLQQEVDDLKNRPEPEPDTVIIKQEVDYSEDRFKAVFAALKGDEEDE